MNKKSVLLILLLSSLFGFACTNSEPFERSSDLFRYLQKEQNLDIHKKEKVQLLILQVGNCGACTREVLKFVEETLPKLPDTTFVLMARNDSTIEANLAKITNAKVLSDDKQMLGKYGLRYVTDYLFVFEKGEITNWFRLDENGLKKAKRYF